MKPKVALVAGAIVAAVLGISLVVVPDLVLQWVGLDAHGDGIILARDLGAVQLGLAVLNWVGRNADGRGLRAVLGADLFVQFAGLLLDGTEILTHQLPGAAWPELSLQSALTLLFGIALLGTRDRSRRRSDRIAAEILS